MRYIWLDQFLFHTSINTSDSRFAHVWPWEKTGTYSPCMVNAAESIAEASGNCSFISSLNGFVVIGKNFHTNGLHTVEL